MQRAELWVSESTNPWFNLAYEGYLVDTVPEDVVYLYLWQNQHTVVIGKHQNPWREVRVDLLEAESGKLARRLSGGGAVYHDLGNLNFTFVMHKRHEDLHRQLKVIVAAAKTLGIDAVFSGRNDILAEGRKFSGNAFYHGKSNYYHHGTLLVDVDMQNLGRYLSASEKKLSAKGVQSVKSRVVNLKALNPEITIPMMKQAMMDAFEVEYGTLADRKTVSEDMSMDAEMAQRVSHYGSWEWRYGKTPEFDIVLEQRFEWGEVALHLNTRGAYISESKVYSDAMSTAFVDRLQGVFDGCRFDKQAMGAAALKLKSDMGSTENASLESMIEDVAQWLSTESI